MDQEYRKRIFPTLSAMAVGGALLAVAQAPIALAADSPTAKSATAEDKGAAKPVDRAEARIKELRAKLHITTEQEPRWNDLVQVMRDNAQRMSTLIEQRDEGVKTASALDDLKAYEQIADAHADGLKKLVPAFEALYNSLSDDQKKTADTIFRNNAAKRSAS